MSRFNWRCPYCQHDMSLDTQYDRWFATLDIPSQARPLRILVEGTACRNEECLKASATVFVLDTSLGKGPTSVRTIRAEALEPRSSARVVPAYVPRAVVADYQEAVAIQNLSPKASATLSRRCLQGMIRDFWRVQGRNLYDEIELIRDQVTEDTWKSMDAVRTLGNIGAHMEKDIDVIVDVDPREAELLVQLIESLLDDWYIARHDREERNKRLQSAAAEKATARANGVSQVPSNSQD